MMMKMWAKAFVCLSIWVSASFSLMVKDLQQCGSVQTKQQMTRGGRRLKYVFGDALSDSPDCIGPEGVPYPRAEIDHLLSKMDSELRKSVFGTFFDSDGSTSREGRTMFDQERDAKSRVEETKKRLLNSVTSSDRLPSFEESIHIQKRHRREADVSESRKVGGSNKSKKKNNAKLKNSTSNKNDKEDEKDNKMKNEKETEMKDEKYNKNNKNTCGMTPSRLCKTTYNTTAPLYGVSLTSGQPVTIVQKFPDLLQQVVYETCESTECEVLHGECVQTFVPYLFLVIPLGPVTLTGQDYVLVESGCTCRPKHSVQDDPDPLSIIPNF